MSEHVVFKHLLVAVQRELLAAHGANFPVALHVFLKLALVVVGWEDDLTEWTPFHVHAAYGKMGAEGEGREESTHIKQSSNNVGQAEVQANKEHLSDVMWVACGIFTQATMHRFRNCRVQQTWMAFMSRGM